MPQLPRCLLAACSMVALAACSGTTATTTTSPVTQVIVRADALLAGHGCGTGDAQAYKYAATIFDADKVPRGTGLYDCFADATFTNLSGSSTGAYTFTLRIQVFNANTYETRSADIARAVTKLDADALDALATLKTSCSATQQPNVQVLAVCDSLP
jgi:hypothetical protein